MNINNQKKILTLDDLVNFYSKYKRSTTFSSKKSGYQLAVQIPATFEIDEDYEDDTLLFCKSRMFHIGENRNHSNVTENAAKKAMKTMAYKPLLANFAEFTDKDGNTYTDFTAHDMVIENDKIKYIEHQIGCITADEPWFEEYEGKTYVCGNLAIPVDYTEAANIIERKNGTKVSVELLINELSYDAKQKSMMLTDVVVSGLTCLGRDPDTGKEVQEGMINSRLDIKDFSRSNNSIVDNVEYSDANTKLVDTLEKLNNTLKNISKFNIDKHTENEEGGVNVKKEFEDNENETVVENESEVIETEKCKPKKNNEVEGAESGEAEPETEAVDDENTEAETFDDGSEDSGDSSSDDSAESDDNTDDEPVENEEPTDGDGTDGSENPDGGDNGESEVDSEPEEPNECEDKRTKLKSEKYSVLMSDGTIKEFTLSLDEITMALYNLVNQTYGEVDNAYYSVQVYENDTLVMCDWWSNKFYRQSYERENDNFYLTGNRVPVTQIWVTKEEEENIKDMKKNYSSIQNELNIYKEAELNSQREAVFNDEAYAEFVDTAEFKEIKEKINTYSVDELRTACDLAFAKAVKSRGTFVLNKNTEKKDEKKSNFFAFARQEQNTSFLDSLLKK